MFECGFECMFERARLNERGPQNICYVIRAQSFTFLEARASHKMVSGAVFS